MACSSVSTTASSEDEKKEQRLIDVMFLCDEWKSSKGGVTTFNREFAFNLAETTTGSMKIHCYVSQSDDRDREDAKQHGVNLITAKTVPGSRDPLDWLKVPPPELQHPHVVIGHGRKLGTPACLIVRTTGCKWIQFVHVFCEDLGKYKNTTTAATDTIEENEEKHKMEIELCKAADAVVAVGSRLQQKYSRSLLNVKVGIITPGIFGKFSNESKLAVDRSVVKNFNLFMFGRATFEDLSLKGYDIVANAIGSLGKNFELTFVGSSPGEHRKVEQWFLDETRINRNQLTIRGYCSEQEELKMMFYQADLVALPSRTEGFGLVSLEAVSAGVPILVSGESGIAKALQEVEGGNAVIVGSDEDEDEWARRIRGIFEEGAEEREANAMKLRENYRKVFSWRTECERFKGVIERVMQKAQADDEVNITTEVEDLKPTESIIQPTTSKSESVACQKADDQRASATSISVGGASPTGKEDIQALKEKAISLIVINYIETTPPKCSDERNKFMEYLEKMQLILKGFHEGSLVITVKCESLQILDELWKDYSSGHLGKVVQNCFVTKKSLKELNLAEMKLKTTMDLEEYDACKTYFKRIALRDALSAQSDFISTEDEVQLKRWKQEREVVESEKVKNTSSILEMSSIGCEKEGEELQETMKGILHLSLSSSSDFDDEPEDICMKCQGTEDKLPLPGSSTFEPEEELEERHMKLQRMKGTSPADALSTAAAAELEGRQKTLKLQERKGSSSSVALSTAGHKKELEGRHETTKLQGEKGLSMAYTAQRWSFMDRKFTLYCKKCDTALATRETVMLAKVPPSATHLAVREGKEEQVERKLHKVENEKGGKGAHYYCPFNFHCRGCGERVAKLAKVAKRKQRLICFKIENVYIFHCGKKITADKLSKVSEELEEECGIKVVNIRQ